MNKIENFRPNSELISLKFQPFPFRFRQFTLPERVATLLEKRRRNADISPREMEVLNLLAKGRSNKGICSELNVSEDTVKHNFRTIFSKLQVRGRTEAVVSAIRHGIVHLD